ncbi:MAG TPA: hypothetical protein VKV40_04825 [Ktedonobacteraceae bacterium]|nr:hypothetical protein [Ktedonobacteraceae bacterium]
MKQFKSIEQLDTGILYALELVSSLSVLLLAFGLIASMANVLTKGSVLTDNILMQHIWAWTQCVAIDASVAGTIIRTFRYQAQGERVKTWLYAFLSALLLFTAAIVSNIESVQQTLNISLDAAYVHVFIPVEALIWIRSIAIVLLIVAHALRHVHSECHQRQEITVPASPPPPIAITPELVDALRALLMQTIIAEETNRPQELPSPQDEVSAAQAARANTEGEHGANNKAVGDSDDEPEANNYDRVKAYLAIHPDAKVREVAGALTISVSTADKWMVRIKGEGL